MSYIGQQTNQQSLNGIIDLTDGTVIIQDGDISNVKSLSINGEIDMNTNKIINLDDGTNPNDAVNKAQLDAVSVNLSDYLRRDGTNAMTGNLNVANNKILNVATPTSGTDATNKNYIDNNFVKLTGNQTIAGLKTFSNDVNLSTKKIINLANGTNLGDAINFTQLTAVNNSLSTEITNIQTNYLKRDGTLSMTGSLNMNTTNKIINLATPTTGKDATNKDYVDTQTNNTNYLLRNGTLSMTGNLNANNFNVNNVANPTSGTDATNKNYVDTHSNNNNYLLRDGTLPMTGNLNLNSNYINNLSSPANGTDASNKNYVDNVDSAIRTDMSTALNLKVNKAGDTMTGDLRLPMVRLIGQTVPLDFVVDETNRTNTYIYFESAGATSDWAYLRQIGGSDNIHLSLDFHNNTNDGAFSLRNVNSNATPDDTPITFFSSNISQTNVKGLLTSDSLTVNGSSLVDGLSVNNNLTVGGSLNISTGGNLKVGGSNGNQYQYLMSQGVNTPSWTGIGKEYKITISGTISKQYKNPSTSQVLIVVFQSSSFTIDPYHSATVQFLGTGGYVGQLVTGGSGTDIATVFFRAVSGSTVYYATNNFIWNGQRGTLNAKFINEFGIIYIPQSSSSRTFTLQLYADLRTDDTYTVSIVDSVICINTQPTYTTSNLTIS